MSPYAISIGLADEHEVLVGVVYEVARDELFYAHKGGGAWLETAEGILASLHVSTVATPGTAFIGMGLPYSFATYNAVATELLHQLYGSVGGVRILGSAATELCYLAAGRMDGRIENSLGAWDIAAGGLILREAGGRLTDYAGRDLFYNAEEVIASNGHLHPYLLSLLTNI
jgi:myo-inositol-1(or 4)-monophosphatase